MDATVGDLGPGSHGERPRTREREGAHCRGIFFICSLVWIHDGGPRQHQKLTWHIWNLGWTPLNSLITQKCIFESLGTFLYNGTSLGICGVFYS